MRRAGLCAMALLVLAGCGHRGSPVPPLPRIPESPRSPTLRQRGDRLEVAGRYHLATLEGDELRPPIAPVLLHYAPRIPGDVTGWDTPAREREFGRESQKLVFDPFPPQENKQVVERRDSVPLATLVTKGAVVIALALRDKSALSFASPRRVFTPALPPLEPLRTFTAISEEGGVRLQWTVTPDKRAVAVRIYRHLPAQPEPLEPWRVARIGEPSLLDETIRYGDDVVYSAVAAAETGEVPVESTPLTTGTIAFRDVFPPRPPSAVDAVAEYGAVRVLWYPGGSPDEAGMRIERQAEGEPGFKPVATVDVPESFYVDSKVDVARRYRYQVVAIDRAGNAAAPAGPTDWVSPRPPEEHK